MAGEITGLIAGAAMSAAQQKQALANAKKGKTKEQKDIIDFFASEYGGAGCGCLNKSSRSMSMDEYQKRVGERCNQLNLKAKAMMKIGLDESEISEIAPICLNSYKFDDDAYVKVENNVAVSSKYCVSWIFFSATQMYTYSFTFDMTSDNTWEETNDFFYQDITCFTTRNKVVERIITETGKGCFGKGESTYKSNYVVDTLEITVPGRSHTISMRDASVQAQSIQAAKSMLRERKFVK